MLAASLTVFEAVAEDVDDDVDEENEEETAGGKFTGAERAPADADVDGGLADTAVVLATGFFAVAAVEPLL